MNVVQRIAKNAAALYMAKVTNVLLNLLYMMHIARYLGAEGFGILSFGLAFTGLFGVFTDMGLFLLTVREIARARHLASKYFLNLSIIKIILGGMTLGLIGLVINILGYPKITVMVVYILALSVALSAVNKMFYSIFQAFEKMEYQLFGQVLSSFLIYSGVKLGINHGFGIIAFASLYPLANIILILYNVVVLKCRFQDSILSRVSWKEIEYNFWKKTIKEALPFGLALIFVTIFYWIDSVMLSLMKGDEVVGWYNAAYRMVLAPLFIPRSLVDAIYPVMSKFYISSKDSLRLSFEKSFKYLTMLGIPFGVGTTLLAKKLILIIFGEGYINSVVPLQILVWSSVFIFMSVTFGNLFNSLNKQIIVTKITGICVGLNVALNLVLIPKYSLIGASIATVLTEFISLVLSIIWSFKIGYSVPTKGFFDIARILFSGSVMGIFVMLFQASLSLLLLVPSAVLVYSAALYIVRGIDREDMLVLQKIR